MAYSSPGNLQSLRYQQKYKISTTCEIRAKVLQLLAEEICVPLTDCAIKPILSEHFPNELKIADVVTIFEKDGPFDKVNFRAISVLQSLSKVYKKLIYQQSNAFLRRRYHF